MVDYKSISISVQYLMSNVQQKYINIEHTYINPANIKKYIKCIIVNAYTLLSILN